MTKLNPEAEAQKTVASFRDAAEKHTTIQQVWGEMAQESKAFGHGSAADKAYFHAVTEGLKKQGLLPELTVAYAQWNKPHMLNDDGDLSKPMIDYWQGKRQTENGRVCEVEQALISNLKDSFNKMRAIGHSKVGDFDHKGITDEDLKAVNAEFSKARHKKEQDDSKEATISNDAKFINHQLLDPRKDDGSVLFDKLSGGGKAITLDSIDKAVEFDDQDRARNWSHHAKGWKSYLNGQDRTAIKELQNQYFDDIAQHDGSITKDDLNRYLAKHSGVK